MKLNGTPELLPASTSAFLLCFLNRLFPSVTLSVADRANYLDGTHELLLASACAWIRHGRLACRSGSNSWKPFQVEYFVRPSMLDV